MQISIEWLNDFVDISDLTADEIAHKLTMLGLEAVVQEKLAGGGNLVVGEVVRVEAHPNADKLSVCVVNAGQAAPLTIVCGAPNVAAGQKVPVALVGAVLPGDIAIKRTKIRGVESEGMICAEDELGLGDDHEGIMVLPEDAPPGAPLMSYLHLDSERLDLDITPNRADAHCHLGAARDLAALLSRELKRPDLPVTEEGPPVENLISVSIEDPAGCPRYVARVVEGVRIGPSPAWLAGRLRQVGLRPINNVVDATNYVLMSIGQPPHAFDLDRLSERRIVVRSAREDESFTTLDSIERRMPAETVMICDTRQPVAVGGIMGGENSEITEQTQNVLIEAAYFNPARIRRASKALGLSTDASVRFERGADYDAAIRAADWCAELIRSIAGGTIARGCIDEYPEPPSGATITLRWSQIPRILGVDVPHEQVVRYLTALGMEIRGQNEDSVTVSQPSWRPDLTREADLIEEVARLWGYDRVPSNIGTFAASEYDDPPERQTTEAVRRWLVGMGLQEIVTSSLVPERETAMIPATGDAIRLANYSSESMSHLRTHMLPSMLGVARHNFHRRSTTGLAVFEVGKVYGESDAGYSERSVLSILLAGDRAGARWGDEKRTCDYYDLRGIVETLIERCSLLAPEIVPYDMKEFVSRTAARIRVAEEEVGALGQVSASIADVYDITVPAFFCQLDLETLAAHRRTLNGVTPLPRFPSVERDLALVVAETTPAESVLKTVQKTGGSLLERVDLFDVYRGKGLAEEEKSLGFNLGFRSQDRTLTDQEVDELVHRIVTVTGEKLGARVRT